MIKEVEDTMAAGACNRCGCSYGECECAERRKTADENDARERLAKEWEEQNPSRPTYKGGPTINGIPARFACDDCALGRDCEEHDVPIDTVKT